MDKIDYINKIEEKLNDINIYEQPKKEISEITIV